MVSRSRLDAGEAEVAALCGTVVGLRAGTVEADYLGWIMRHGAGGREIVQARWGLSRPSSCGRAIMTSVGDITAEWLRPILVPEQRCIVPATAFGIVQHAGVARRERWFGLDGDQVFGLAAVWMEWTGRTGSMLTSIDGKHLLFGLMTAPANLAVGTSGARRMPVMLRTSAEIERWLSASVSDLPELCRTLPDGVLTMM